MIVIFIDSLFGEKRIPRMVFLYASTILILDLTDGYGSIGERLLNGLVFFLLGFASIFWFMLIIFFLSGVFKLALARYLVLNRLGIELLTVGLTVLVVPIVNYISIITGQYMSDTGKIGLGDLLTVKHTGLFTILVLFFELIRPTLKIKTP